MRTPPFNADYFAARVLQDAWVDATAAYWERRAQAYEWARPRRDDFVPAHVTREERQERWDRLTQLAAACRARAQLAWHTEAELRDAMDDELRGRTVLDDELDARWNAIDAEVRGAVA